MADIFEEVEEGIRQDKWTERWQRYGLFVYLVGGLIVGGTALNEYMQYRQASTLTTNALAFEAALTDLDAGDFEGAAQQLETLANSGDRIAIPAGHMLAQARYDGNGDQQAAAAMLGGIAADVSSSSEKLALLKRAYLLADTTDRADLEVMLSPLRQDDDAFNALATELIAAKALADGDYDFARQEYNVLRISGSVPEGVYSRAGRALATIPPPSTDSVEFDPLFSTPAEEETAP